MQAQSSDPDASLVALGQAVRTLRLKNALSQEQLAVRVGIHPTYISRIEAGRRNISWEAMQRISRALDLPVWQFVRVIEEMEQNRGGQPAGGAGDER